ncbi:ras association domain-containing protein 5-like isoform X1 [Trichomycterus rosablanca]|uniref:ras association domain-containing protein 5-like isoform X1 n=1 Tax=Trichomycterus rosablanca TaxID=2290929 RepID=UPI002F35E06A
MRPAEEAAVSGACFGHVSRHLNRLFRRLPKSRSWSEGLRLLRRSSSSGTLELSDCSYTCHLKCEGLVQVDCNQRDVQKEETTDDSTGSSNSTPPPDKNAVKEEEEENPQSLSEEDIRAKIDEYNSKVTENEMKSALNGTYTGFIKVHLKLRRPVTVLSAEIKDSGSNSATADISDKRTSFYLPSEAVKQLHISSVTTVSEVIEGLLKKFQVQDNPRKFALYKQTHRHGQDLTQKLSDSEHPLHLRLVAGPDPESLSFVLKENDTGEVEWHAFSVPELQNFLTILKKEEKERVKQVEHRYVAYRRKLVEALQEMQNKPG